MSDYTMSAYDLAVSMYDASDKVGVPLHDRTQSLIDLWVKAAQRKIASGAVSMDDIATTGAAH
jgi:hypothetical protein